jgi:hypothetical protein
VERNVIAANRGDGVEISAVRADLLIGTRDNIVAGNLIKSNNGHGVHVHSGAENNRIGTDGFNVKLDSGEGNEIVGNLGDGVRVIGAGTVKNSIRGNSIHSNELLGIDLGGDGVTANDALDRDSGPNELQNYPELKSVWSDGTRTRVRGKLKSLPRTSFTLDFYASAEADPSGFGEGRRWLGSFDVTTNAGGVVNFNLLLDEATSPGEFVTATATEKPAGNTSEFSEAAAVAGASVRAAQQARRAPGAKAVAAVPPRIAAITFARSSSIEASGPTARSGAYRHELVGAENRPASSRELAVHDAALALETVPTATVALTHAASARLPDTVSDEELLELTRPS